jgi:tetratricopeptide (TPR) repeat protein
VTLGEQLSSAIEQHKSGDLKGAEAAYQAILEREPASCDARHLLGVVAHQQGDHHRATELIQEALQLNPDAPAFHCNLGVALKAKGKLEQAVGSYRRALQLAPEYAEAHCNLGSALRRQGKIDESEASLRQALRIRPRYADALSSLGATLRRQGKTLEAIAACETAVELKPRSAEALINLGNALRDDGKPEEAIEVLRGAARLSSNNASVFSNLGNAHQDLGSLAEACECYDRAIELKPDYVEALTNLGAALRLRGDLFSAAKFARQALEIDPEFAEAHWNLALFLLSSADFDAGWAEYEWRWKLGNSSSRQFDKPLWEGQILDGQTLLVHAEQGFGDTIQFVRYLRQVKDLCGRVVFEAPPPLVTLLQGVPGIGVIVAAGQPLPNFDAHCPLLSLPRIFKTSLETVPRDVPYLQADAILSAQWNQRLGPCEGRRVGLCWQGSPTFAGDRLRSIPLHHYQALADVPNVSFVSLQKEHGLDQLRGGAFPGNVLDISAELKDFSTTAAVISNLNLVISSDTSVAHLAGALGVPVWLALQYAPDWRWLTVREDSPWYPTLRLFRQSTLQDWPDVFERIATALKIGLPLT